MQWGGGGTRKLLYYKPWPTRGDLLCMLSLTSSHNSIMVSYYYQGLNYGPDNVRIKIQEIIVQ